MTITKIGFCVVVAASVNDACDAGIFSGDGAILLGSAGSTLGKLNGAVGMQTLTLQAPVSLVAGQVYYAAWAGAVGGTSVQTAQFIVPAVLDLPFGTAPPNIEAAMGGAPPGPGAPGDQGDQGGSDLLSGMSATDHIRAAIKHLMMAMTESGNDEESHGIVKGMAALHGILAGKQKADATVTAAGGTPAGG